MSPLEATPLMTVDDAEGIYVEELEEWPQAVRKSRDMIANVLCKFMVIPPIFSLSLTR
jgi:hypothetical protein